MSRRHLKVVAVSFGFAALVAACGSSPTAPDLIEFPGGTHQAILAAVTGTGSGAVSVTPKQGSAETFNADIKVRVQKAKANTVYTVQRAPEIGRAFNADGVCQRAASISPWGPSDLPPAPAFVTFVSGGTPQTITTDASGNGSVDFPFTAPGIAAGTVFDVMFRLVDIVGAPTSEIRSGCFTVTTK